MADVQYLLSERTNPYSRERDDGGQWWGYPQRRGAIRAIGVHTAETQPSPASSLNVARWQAYTASSPSSYHVIVDSDHRVRTVLDHQVAFHIASFNTPSLGLSFATYGHKWGQYPVWDEEALQQAAVQARRWVETYDIPLRWLKQDAANAGEPGFVRHSVMDPDRRSDPGKGFPAKRFFGLVSEATTDEEEEGIVASIDDLRRVINEERDELVRERVNEITRLSEVGAAHAVASIRKELGLDPDPESDQVHVRRMRNDTDYDLTEVRRRLTEAVE